MGGLKSNRVARKTSQIHVNRKQCFIENCMNVKKMSIRSFLLGIIIATWFKTFHIRRVFSMGCYYLFGLKHLMMNDDVMALGS